MTVCKAFKYAQSGVAAQFGKAGFAGEEVKFCCLHNHKANEECNSKGILVYNGLPMDISNKVQIKNLPLRVSGFTGRGIQCCETLKFLSETRLVWLEGIPGIGKSAIAKEVAHLAYDRDIYKDGVLYLSIKDCQMFESFIEKVFFTFMDAIQDKKIRDELEHYVSSTIGDKYKKSMSMIKDLNLLIVFDNCDNLVANEQNNFKKFIEDISQKVQKSRILFTSKVAISDFLTMQGYVFKIEKLTNQQVYELLEKKTKSRINVKQELIFMRNNSSQRKAKKNSPEKEEKKLIYDHDFFKMLNGHPLSTLLVASLRNDISFDEIYRVLKRIKRNQNTTKTPIEDLILPLNIETSSRFVRKQNLDAYMVLLCFALCPSGLTTRDCIYFCKNWKKSSKLLLDRSLIKVKQSSLLNKTTDGKEDYDETSNQKKIHKESMFSMDLSLLKAIELSLSVQDKAKIDTKVVERLVSLLQKNISNKKMQAKERYSDLRKYEGNIWAALNRMQEQESQSSLFKTAESLYDKRGSGFRDLTGALRKGLLNTAKNAIPTPEVRQKLTAKNKIKRKGTYHSKKRELLDSCFADDDKTNYGDGMVSNNQLTPEEEKHRKTISNIISFLSNSIKPQESKEKKKLRTDQNVQSFAQRMIGLLHKDKNKEIDEICHERQSEEDKESSEQSYDPHSDDEMKPLSDIEEEVHEHDKDQKALEINVDSDWKSHGWTSHQEGDHQPQPTVSPLTQDAKSIKEYKFDRSDHEKKLSNENDESESQSHSEESFHAEVEVDQVRRISTDIIDIRSNAAHKKSKTVQISDAKHDSSRNLLQEPKKLAHALPLHSKLAIYFATCLFQCRQMEATVRVIEETALE